MHDCELLSELQTVGLAGSVSIAQPIIETMPTRAKGWTANSRKLFYNRLGGTPCSFPCTDKPKVRLHLGYYLPQRFVVLQGETFIIRTADLEHLYTCEPAARGKTSHARSSKGVPQCLERPRPRPSACGIGTPCDCCHKHRMHTKEGCLDYKQSVQRLCWNLLIGPLRLLPKRRGLEPASVESDNDASRRRSLQVGFEVWRPCTWTGQYLQTTPGMNMYVGLSSALPRPISCKDFSRT